MASDDSAYPELKKSHTIARQGRPFTDRKPPAAAPVWAVIDGFGQFHTLAAAIEVGAFEALDRLGPATGEALAGELGVSPRHLTALLEGVVALGLLEHHHGRFLLTDAARRYLLRASPASMVDLIPVSPGPFGNWAALASTVRTGQPPNPVDDDAGFYAPLVEATFATIHRCALRADLQLRYTALAAPRVLELGAGGAPWSAAVLGAVPGAAAVVNDLPGVVDIAARRLAEHAVADRVELRPGDYLTVDVEPAAYDLVVLGHVLRAESDERARALVERAAAALRPGGRVVIGDYFADRQRAHNPHALTMGVTMIANTRHGRVLRYGDVAGWMRTAGFEALRLIEPIGFQQVAVGTLSRQS
ncbi:MAG TPA: class I SAM-dependent methyltransferase [Ilumatobacter sp.]|nr:class I SAM-dependent methyltransferase [Ilumatobacter sp.]